MLININSLLPDELEKVQQYINEILGIKQSARITNIKYQEKYNKKICPYCNSDNVVKNGHKNQTQRYKCKSCNKFYSISTLTIISYIGLGFEQLIKCMKGFLEQKNRKYFKRNKNIS